MLHKHIPHLHQDMLEQLVAVVVSIGPKDFAKMFVNELSVPECLLLPFSVLEFFA